LKDAAGGFVPESFRVDTATDLTTFSAFRAKELGLPMPPAASPGLTHRQTGLAIRSGLLRFRIAGMDLAEYAVSCFLLGDPYTPPAGAPASFPRKLLQPFQLLDQLRFTAEKNPARGNLYGELVVEKR
jgi:hypothetical protein